MDPRSTLPDVAFAPGPPTGVQGLRHLLAVHCARSDTAYAALLEESGCVYADAGDESLRDYGETAALAVGAWHATREVARRLGEPGFQGLSHEGTARHFHISPVDDHFLLLSVFGNDTKLAIVRATAHQTAAALREALKAGAGPEMSPAPRGSLHDGDIHFSAESFLAFQ